MELIGQLSIEPDEVAVLSVVLEMVDANWHLLRGSLIVAQEEIGAGNWSTWETAHQVRPTGQPEPDRPSYRTSGDHLLVCRTAVPVDQAQQWLEHLLSAGTTTPIDTVPRFSADLRPPSAPIRLSPRLDSDASTFIGRAVRPAVGFHFRGPTVAAISPTFWTDGTNRYIDSALSVGLHLSGDSPGGLVVCRLERRAWFNELRGGENLETYDCFIGHDPRRIDVTDLVIDLEEFVDGELVHAQRLALDSIAVDKLRGAPAVVVRLPTVGYRVERSVRLYDRDGYLLDSSSSRFRIFERVSVTVGLLDSPDHLAQPADDHRPDISLPERSADIERVRRQYRDLFEEGADAVLLPSRNALDTIRERLRQARGRLRIADLYFGERADDWSILQHVAVPVELLVGKQYTIPSSVNAQVRRATKSPKVLGKSAMPFHGRLYLWDDGGLSVDASPSSFDSADVYVSPLNAAVARHAHRLFDVWWADATPLS